MKALLDYARSLFVSLEFLLLLTVVLSLLVRPDLTELIPSKIHLTSDQSKWLALVPLTLLGLTVKASRNLRLPADDNRSLLQKWPKYSSLQLLANISIFYASLFALFAITGWLASEDWIGAWRPLVLIVAAVGGAITYLSIYFAEVRVNELLREAKETN